MRQVQGEEMDTETLDGRGEMEWDGGIEDRMDRIMVIILPLQPPSPSQKSKSLFHFPTKLCVRVCVCNPCIIYDYGKGVRLSLSES